MLLNLTIDLMVTDCLGYDHQNFLELLREIFQFN